MLRTATSVDTAKRSRPLERTRVAYVMSWFPKLTETFVLYEILAVERKGVEVELYPLRRGTESTSHAEAARLASSANYQPWFSLAFLRSHGHFLIRRPWVYLATLARLLWANLGSLRYFAAAVLFFPKMVHMARLMERKGIQHVHAHFASHPAAAAWVISRLTGIPFSFTAHGSDLHCDRHMLYEKVRDAAFVATISSYNRDLIVAECGKTVRSKVRVIHCGVDTGVFTARELTGAHARKKTRILCIGTLHEVKGQTYVIDACRRLQQRGLDVECHLAGDGPDRGRLAQQAADAGLADRVHFHGACTRSKIIALLGLVDLVVAPSVLARSGSREGIPVALMEAMASGVPVVASNISGIPELVEHEETGLLAPPRDAEALATALARLAEDHTLRRHVTRAARQKVEREFNLDRNAARLARCFRVKGAA